MPCHDFAASGAASIGAQLSALNQFRAFVDVAVVVVVLALANLVAHFTTPWAAVATVPAVAVGLVALVRCNGLSWAELGLGRAHWKSGSATPSRRYWLWCR